MRLLGSDLAEVVGRSLLDRPRRGLLRMRCISVRSGTAAQCRADGALRKSVTSVSRPVNGAAFNAGDAVDKMRSGRGAGLDAPSQTDHFRSDHVQARPLHAEGHCEVLRLDPRSKDLRAAPQRFSQGLGFESRLPPHSVSNRVPRHVSRASSVSRPVSRRAPDRSGYRRLKKAVEQILGRECARRAGNLSSSGPRATRRVVADHHRRGWTVLESPRLT